MRYLLLMLILACALIARAQDEPSSMTLVIAAQNVQGEPMAGVSFSAGPTTATMHHVTTDQMGFARVPLKPNQKLEQYLPVLDDARFQTASISSPQQAAGNGRSQYVFVRLLPAEISDMTALERSVYVDQMANIVRAQWKSEGLIPGEKHEPHMLRLAAFLDGFGREQVVMPREVRARNLRASKENLGPDGKPKPQPSIEVTVLDRSGRPAAHRLVLLYELAEKPGTIQIAESRRTNAQGVANFTHLSAPALYRAEVPAEDAALVAPGPPVLLPAPDDPKRPPVRKLTLVLRERRRSVSGIVTYEGRPARGVSVQTQDPAQPTVSAQTDELGYFEIGPLHEGETTLRISDPRTARSAQITAVIGTGELLLPLDVLTQD